MVNATQTQELKIKKKYFVPTMSPELHEGAVLTVGVFLLLPLTLSLASPKCLVQPQNHLTTGLIRLPVQHHCWTSWKGSLREMKSTLCQPKTEKSAKFPDSIFLGAWETSEI